MARRQQATIFDTAIDDPRLSELFHEELALAPEAKKLRAIKKEIRKRLEEHHPELIGEDAGWVRCDGFRFKPRKRPRPAGSVDIGEGEDWSCPVEAL